MHARQAASLKPPPQAEEFADLYGHFQLLGGSERFYDAICDELNFPARIAPGLMGHFAGHSEQEWEVIDLWNDAESMERVFSRHLADAIPQAIALTGERFDIEPEMRRIARLVVGPDAAAITLDSGGREKLGDRALRPIGAVIENLGGGEDEYLRGCAMLGFPERIPDGLIVHMAGPSADGWRVFDCWRTAEQCDAWFERVAGSIAAVDGGSGIMSEARFRRLELVRAFVDPRLAGGGYL